MNLPSLRHFCRVSPSVWSAGLAVCCTLPLAAQMPPEVDFSSPALLPPTGVLKCAQGMSFAGSAARPKVDIRDFNLCAPQNQQMLPASGDSMIQSFSTRARAMLAVGDGTLSQPVEMTAVGQVLVTGVTDADGSLHFDTEMLRLDLTGGSLPTGMRLRESPTLHSTGTTKIRRIDSSGRYRIDSFFDIFTELSTDGGATWLPAIQVSHCGLQAPSVEAAFAAPALPPGGSVHEAAGPVVFANGVMVRHLALRNPTAPQAPPALGAPPQDVSTSCTVTGELSLDNGSTFSPFECSCDLGMRVTHLFDDSGVSLFDTEMLALNLTGGSLPQGVMLRESPSKASLGRTSLRLAPDNQYRVSSFFDVFTEISLNSGQTWSPCSNGACVCAFIRESPSHFFTNACFPLPADFACGSGACVSFGASGVVIRNFRDRPTASRSPVASPWAPETRSLGGAAACDVSIDGGLSFSPASFPFAATETSTSKVSLPGGGGIYKVCYSVDCTIPPPSSGGVPAGSASIKLRESPSKPSLGKTTLRTTPGGFMISSFFDVFLELSTDGGKTWTPADSALHLALLPYLEQENIFANAYLPPRDGRLEMRLLDSPADFPNGVLVRNLHVDQDATSNPLFDTHETSVNPLHGNGSCEFSTDGGQTWSPASGPVTGSVAVTRLTHDGAWDALTQFDTEMVSLECAMSGGTPSATVMLRESPSKASLGRCSVQRLPDGSACRIDSFFDVFTEVSLDGGATWSPAADAVRMQLRRQQTACFCRTDWVPVALDYRAPDSQFFCSAGQTGIRAFAMSSPAKGVGSPGGVTMHPDHASPADFLFSTPVSFDLTLDGGVTISSVACNAAVTLRISGSSDAAGGSVTQECLQFDLSGGTLPPTMRVRESPTLAPRGQTTVRIVAGGYRIRSFFDIFTEVSLDSGATWTPLCSPLHLEACETPPDMLSTSATEVQLDQFTTPPGGLLPQCARSLHFNYGEIKVVYKEQGRSSAAPVVLPLPGATTTVSHTGSADFLYSTDGGVTSTPVHCDIFSRYALKFFKLSDSQTIYHAEMLQLDLSGGNLPSGVMIRESPTLPSHGKLSLRESPTLPSRPRSYRVSSFFDVFNEISLDSGMTWQPFDLPLHLQCDAPPAASMAQNIAWPPPGQFELWPANGDLDFSAIFANGASMSFFDIFPDLSLTGPPLPTPTNPPVVIPNNGRCRFHFISPDGTPVDEDCNVACTVRFTATGTFSDGTSCFDTEMLACDLSGGTLPPGMLLRESPSKASLGKHTVRMSSGGGGGGGAGGFLVSSFFDVFLELSTDSGKTWSPAAAPLHLEFTAAQISVVDQDNTVLVSGSSTVALGPYLTGTGVTRTFTVTNNGSATTGVAVSFEGPNAGDFSLVNPLPTSLQPRSSLTFSWVLSSSAPGQKSATLHLTSNDPSQNPFDVFLAGRALLPNADDDGDGVSNADELALAALGFDPLVDSSKAIQALRDHGFFRAGDMHALALGRPVLQRNAGTGHFHLQVGIRESPTLQSWAPLTDFSATHDPATGLLDLDIPPDSSQTMFYQVFGSPP